MVDLAVLQSVSYIAGALGVCVAAFYYVITLRISQKNQEINQKNQELSLKTQKHTLETRQTQLTMQIYEKMWSAEWREDFFEMMNDWSWTDYDDFMKKYGPLGEPGKWTKFSNVCGTWELVGILLRYEAFDPRMLYDMWGGFFQRFWEKLEPFVVEYNVRAGGGFLEYVEDIYYYFQETMVKDRVEFREREKIRHGRRVELGLKPRPVYRRAEVTD